MLRYPLYAINKATGEIDYSKKWVIEVAELDDATPSQSDPETYSFDATYGPTNGNYIRAESILNSYPEIGTVFMAEASNWIETINMYWGAWTKHSDPMYSGNRIVTYNENRPGVYLNYGNIAINETVTKGELKRAYNPTILRKVFGLEKCVCEGVDKNHKEWSTISSNVDRKELPDGWAWYNPSNGRCMDGDLYTRTIRSSRTSGPMGVGKYGKLCMGAGVSTNQESGAAAFMAVKKGTLVDGKITKDTYVCSPSFSARQSIDNNTVYANLRPWNPSISFGYVNNSRYEIFFYDDVIITRTFDGFKKLSDRYTWSYFALLEGATPDPDEPGPGPGPSDAKSIYWNGSWSNDPYVNVGGTNYNHSDGYIWNGHSWEHWWKKP